MLEMDLTDNFSVLLLEESQTLQTLFDEWLDGIPTKLISSPREISTHFDETVAVACLSLSALDDKEEKIRKYILTRNPYCQLVALLPRSTFMTIHEKDYDGSMQRPIFEDEFQQIITKRFARGVYSALLREFYELNPKLIWLNRTDTPEDVPDDVNAQKLRERHNQLSSQLNSLREKLSSKDIEAISDSIDLHKQYLTQPDSDHEEGTATKYHPSRCPACKLSWGVDHGNELNRGLVSIGAGVWKCTRCSEIVHGLGESGRRVMRG